MSCSKPVDKNVNSEDKTAKAMAEQVSQGCVVPISSSSPKKPSADTLYAMKGIIRPMASIMEEEKGEEEEEEEEEEEVPKLSNLILDIKLDNVLVDFMLCDEDKIKVSVYAPKEHMHIPGTIIRGMDGHLIPNPCIEAKMIKFSPPVDDYIRIYREGKWKVPENFEKPPGISLPPWHYRLFAPKDQEESKSQLKLREPPKGWIHPFSDPARRHLYFPSNHHGINASPITSKTFQRNKRYSKFTERNKRNSINSTVSPHSCNINVECHSIIPPPGLNIDTTNYSSILSLVQSRNLLPPDTENLLDVIDKLQKQEASESCIIKFFQDWKKENYLEGDIYKKGWSQSQVLRIQNWETQLNHDEMAISSLDTQKRIINSDCSERGDSISSIESGLYQPKVETRRRRHLELDANSNDKHSTYHSSSHPNVVVRPRPPMVVAQSQPNVIIRSHPYPKSLHIENNTFKNSYHHQEKQNYKMKPELSLVNSEPLGNPKKMRSNNTSEIPPYKITKSNPRFRPMMNQDRKEKDYEFTHSYYRKKNYNNRYDNEEHYYRQQKNNRMSKDTNTHPRSRMYNHLSQGERNRRGVLILDSLITGKVVKYNSEQVHKTFSDNDKYADSKN